MSGIRVDSAALTLTGPDGRTIRCAIGRSGACPAGEKREGDGRTPLGRWPIRTVLFRPGHAAPPAGMSLPWRWVRPDDGWSDDPADPAYNRPVRHPHAYSAERLVRDDGAYDVIVVLGHNDAPPVSGMGSAVFLHCSEGRPTAGCVAVEKGALLALLPLLGPGDAVGIV
ncbi:L,D-transpeptidase [Rhizorhabdus histidinilytica]|uniref:L,D-peptidoglycan transpeptidase YkuD, ErfK/YbiS/YcfS/YnhG family n=1 Tax=Rhizorhabdus histidinilytica TaxID=439228 RepID=A0A1T5AW16_9SPHN|nr:L,D-transpeptidase family protein [Rhizorhabdus histidinilytica]SKB38783.1 L,D-peptidoglycan transpeptidase YkuD, ErfK/YbiS/YcfS/YnhG family [Rhizorhabdus histidinilytica]